MKVDNIKIYDLEESIIASGYPMRTEAVIDKQEWLTIYNRLHPDKVHEIEGLNYEKADKAIKRCLNLAKASNGNGAHGQWLTGVRVAFDLTCSNKMWVEAERYRFLEFVSSQSTMHRISKFDIDKQCNQYVDGRVMAIVDELKDKYNEKPSTESYLKLLYNIPSGFELTARVTTNYRCLLNIYIQRHDHRLPEWREFCEKLLELPLFKQLVDAYYNKQEEVIETINETETESEGIQQLTLFDLDPEVYSEYQGDNVNV